MEISLGPGSALVSLHELVGSLSSLLHLGETLAADLLSAETTLLRRQLQTHAFDSRQSPPRARVLTSPQTSSCHFGSILPGQNFTYGFLGGRWFLLENIGRLWKVNRSATVTL